MSDSHTDPKLRETLLKAFPAPAESEGGDWRRVLRVAKRRPTLVEHAPASRGHRFVTPRKIRLAVALAAFLILGFAVGVATAAETGVYIPWLGINVSPKRAAALEREHAVATTDANTNTETVPAPEFIPSPIPAEMLPAETPVPVGESLLQPTNDWLVSDGYTLVAVYAGSAGNPTGSLSPTNEGRVVIVRQNLETGAQSMKLVDAGTTGALTITNAPLGASVEKSALTGDLDLHAADGESLVLHLATDTITG